MRLPIILMLVVIMINLLSDYYIWKVLCSRLKKKIYSKIHVVLSVLLLIYLVIIIALPKKSGSDSSLLSLMWMLMTYFSIYLPKYIFILIDIIASIPKLWKWKRVRAISIIGLLLSILTFGGIWWGALVNRKSVDVVNVELHIPTLSNNFENYKIAQISDLHVGTYQGDTTHLSKMVETINELNVDLVVFTGDIVNRKSDELLLYVDILSKIKAKDGVFSILGNHDYGDYIKWDTEKDYFDNKKLLCDLQTQMNWTLLRNQTEFIKRGNDSIAIIGVENIGDPPFPVYGSLIDAYPTLNDSTIKILLTHNPAHWVSEIENNENINIALTLSGHTHAMQVSVFGFSPASLRYKTWGGLYVDDFGHNLYVNIGMGTVGIPVRLGATPEVTLFTLKK